MYKEQVHIVYVPSIQLNIRKYNLSLSTFLSSGDSVIAEEPSAYSDDDQPKAPPMLRKRAQTISTFKPAHVRARSDITDDIVRYMRMEEGRNGSATPPLKTMPDVDDFPIPVPGSEAGMGTGQVEGEADSEWSTSPGTHKEEEEKKDTYELPSIDVEVNITINVDSGRIVLRSEET